MVPAILASENKKDKFSRMDRQELANVIKMLTAEIDGGRGLPIPRYSWSEKTMRQFVRFLYRNLKEGYVARAEVTNALKKETEKMEDKSYY